MGWPRYMARQCLFSLLAFWVVLSLTFFLHLLVGLHPLTPSFVRTPTAQGPAWQQYLSYLGSALRFDFGPSLDHEHVSPGGQVIVSAQSVVAQALPWTLLLVGTGTVIALLVGTILGIVLAWHRGSQLDTWVTAAVIFITSIPYYFAAIMLLFYVALTIPWFPTSGAYSPSLTPTLSAPFVADLLRHLILPVVAVVLGTFGLWVLPMRNAMVAVMDDDFMLFAHAKGVAVRRLLLSYAARNALLPVATNFAIQLGYVLGGAVFVEMVFAWPGAGALLVTALRAQDYPVLQALIVTASAAALLANLAVKAAYPLLDPRVRHG